MHRLVRPLLTAAFLAASAAQAAAQTPPPPSTVPATATPTPTPTPEMPPGSEEPPPEETPPEDTPPAPVAGTPDTPPLSCSGDQQFTLIDDREEIGPARFAREADLEKDLALSGAATAFCVEAGAKHDADVQEGAADASAAPDWQGPCYGLMLAGNKMESSARMFDKTQDASGDVGSCLTDGAQAGGKCEAVRNQLTTLRTYDEIVVSRAELVLAYEVCDSDEVHANKELRGLCTELKDTVTANSDGGGQAGLFELTTLLPTDVRTKLDKIRNLTSGRYLSAHPELGEEVRESMCAPDNGKLTTGLIDRAPFQKQTESLKNQYGASSFGSMYASVDGNVKWSMCNELNLAMAASQACRAASIYVDERGEIHLNSALTTRSEREDATICIDISDFDPDQPLMMTLGLDATGSVPERIWPGEVMKIGSLIDHHVSREDVMTLNVFGRAHGSSLAEVLAINGVTISATMTKDQHDEACRMARSWVPVVDHEVPIGDPRHQAIIPVEFNRGRVGETKRIDEGDYVVIWVKDIQPDGMVQIDAGQGQYVGYQPPPLLGESEAGQPSGSAAAEPGYTALEAPSGAVSSGKLTTLAMRRASVAKIDLKRRARYPGSRVLRLGTPAGNHDFPLKVCTNNASASKEPTATTTTPSIPTTLYDYNGQYVSNPVPGTTYYLDYYHSQAYTYPAASSSSSSSASLGAGCTGYIVDEHMFVHGSYHMGISMYFGYSSLPIKNLTARPIGGGEYEVVQTGANTATYDLAVMLDAYPFGRDPHNFSYRPWSKEYWKGAALLAGFGLRNITRPWDDFYAGASLPVANGVSATFVAHVSQRQLPLGVQAGDTFTPMSSSDTSIDDNFGTQGAIVVGYSFGLSFDFDLFERAFTNTISRFRNHTTFDAGGNQPYTQPPGNPY